MKLSELRDQIAALPTLAAKREGIVTRLADADAQVAELLARYEKEKRDAANMEKDSFSNFILRTFDRYDEKAEREQREEIEAKLRYDRARTEQGSLREEIERLDGRIAELQNLSAQYTARIEEKKAEFEGRLDGSAGQHMAELEQERRSMLSQMTEVSEAMGAAQRAFGTAENARNALDKAEGWANWDLVGGRGFLSHAVKYSHINTAEQYFHQLSAQLREMQAELLDIQGFAIPGMESISGAWQMADFFFDNIFVDLSVRSTIVENGQRIDALMRDIQSVQIMLEERRTRLAEELRANGKRQEDIIVDLG